VWHFIATRPALHPPVKSGLSPIATRTPALAHHYLVTRESAGATPDGLRSHFYIPSMLQPTTATVNVARYAAFNLYTKHCLSLQKILDFTYSVSSLVRRCTLQSSPCRLGSDKVKHSAVCLRRLSPSRLLLQRSTICPNFLVLLPLLSCPVRPFQPSIPDSAIPYSIPSPVVGQVVCRRAGGPPCVTRAQAFLPYGVDTHVHQGV